ncbi:MAG TPA: RNA polymerase sigma factor [Candidatus Limnocylindrales bacterium]|jgi:RNA polymerase sigma-70 factor (ECF subfamily)|nr:RNA polymerase sigma factor [Candidatus Limnocylindrales bacterium]
MSERERRDRAADQAYRDHANDVYRVAYGILRDPDEALDATHDTFARAWERWDQYDSQRPLRGWLHGIVVHVALDQLRRRRVRRLALPNLGRSPVAHLETSVADAADDVARRELVDRALDGLRPSVRATLVLRHYYGYDYAEIAAMLGMSSGNVGSTLSRAHAAIRERLEAAEPAAAPRSAASAGLAAARRPSRGTTAEPPEVLP